MWGIKIDWRDLIDYNNLLIASPQREDRNDSILYPGGGAVH